MRLNTNKKSRQTDILYTDNKSISDQQLYRKYADLYLIYLSGL